VVKVSDYKNTIPFMLKIANCFVNEPDGMRHR